MKITTTKKELQKIIREERQALLKEASMEQIQSLNGKEVSMRYRKATGETKTYFGRVVASPKAGPGKFFMGVLNQGLKLFKADGVIGISAASLSEYFDEMCHDECITEMLESVPKAWSGTAKAMSKHKEVDNPWALTNWMAKKGATPHYQPTKKEEAGMFSHGIKVGSKVTVNGQKGTVSKVWSHPTLGMVATVFVGGKYMGVPVDKLQEKCGSPVLKPQFKKEAEEDDAELINKAPGQGAKGWYEGKKKGLKETPAATSLGTRNIQTIKKCPTCEAGDAQLKLGCPTCGGSGRVKSQDKFQEEYIPQPQGKFVYFYKAPDEKSFKQVKSWLKAMGIPYKLDGTHFLAEPNHRAAITKYMRADDPSYKWPQ